MTGATGDEEKLAAWIDDVRWWAERRAEVAEIVAAVRNNPRTEPEAVAELLAALDVIDGILARMAPREGSN